jgi:hypothetical protein
MVPDKVYKTLSKHLPTPSLNYCYQLWQQSPFTLKIRKSRQTKVGDFSCKHGGTPQITVNEDLHQYLFLMTYLHEVAHLHVHKMYGHHIEAHGDIWKNTFRELMMPMMNSDVFPPNLLKALARHMTDPPASTFTDSKLTELFRSFDPRWSRTTLLSEISEGSLFGLNGKWFRKGALQRTRVLCIEIKTKRQFLVPADMPVSDAQLSLL